MCNMHILSELPFYTYKVKFTFDEARKGKRCHRALIAALIIVAFWGIPLPLMLLTAVIAVIAYLAFVPALWEHYT